MRMFFGGAVEAGGGGALATGGATETGGGTSALGAGTTLFPSFGSLGATVSFAVLAAAIDGAPLVVDAGEGA